MIANFNKVWGLIIMDNNWNGQTWNGQNGYNQYNGQNQQQLLYAYNKPVETLESIKYKFNSTAKWLKAMGIISQMLMCCGYSAWIWTESHSPVWTETYVDDYGISGMAKLASLCVGFFGLMLLIQMVCFAIPLFICQVMYNKPGKRPDEIGMKITSISDMLMCLVFCLLGYWIAVPTLIITVILQFRATSLRLKMENIYIQQTGQNMNGPASYVNNQGQSMNNMGQNMGGQNSYMNNPGQNTNNPVVYEQNPVYNNINNNQYTQEQREQDQPVKNDDTVSEKVTNNQESINTETNKEQIQTDETKTIENNGQNPEKSQDQEKPEIKATENGGESIG